MARYPTTLLVIMVAAVSLSNSFSLDGLKDIDLKNVKNLLEQYQQTNSTINLPLIINILKSVDLKSILEKGVANTSLVTQTCYNAYKGLSQAAIFNCKYIFPEWYL